MPITTRPPTPTNITLTNLQICNACPDQGNGTIELASAQNVTITNNRLGPVCCGLLPDGTEGSSPAELIIGNRANTPVSTNINIANNLFMGEIRLSSLFWPTAALGPAPQGDCNSCHTDAVHVLGGKNLSFVNNIFYNSQTSVLFLEDVNGQFTNITIVGNYLDSLGACGLCVHARATRGNWLVAFNTSNAGMGFSGTDFPSDARVQLIGNYGPLGNKGADLNSNRCSVGAPTLAYQYNVWTNDGGASNMACGTGDAVIASLLVTHRGNWAASPPDNGVNYDLGPATAADDRVPASTCTSVTSVDLHGTSRGSNGKCDAGADER